MQIERDLKIDFDQSLRKKLILMKIDHAGVSASELRLQPLLPQNCERNRGIENSSYIQCHYVGARKPNLLERLVRPHLDRK